MTRPLLVLSCLCCIVIHATSGERASAQLPAESDSSARTFQPRTVLRKPIRAIVDAPVIAADEVDGEVSDNELVLGVIVDGAARAYPINMLHGPSREIINDRLGDRLIAATW